MGRNRAGADGVGSIHAVDVHPSRKHLCVVSFEIGVHSPTFYLFGQVNLFHRFPPLEFSCCLFGDLSATCFQFQIGCVSMSSDSFRV